jgi:serine protease 16
MQYLNVDQALADVAYFIDNRKFQMNISNSKVIVFGGSYAGNMAAWIRTKYPHLIKVIDLL